MDYMMNLQSNHQSNEKDDNIQYTGGSFTPQPRKKSINENVIEMQMNSVLKKRKTKLKILGICGGQSCGKTLIVNYFHKRIEGSMIISERDFLKNSTDRKRSFQDEKENKSLVDEFDGYSKERKFHLVNLSDPDSYDFDLLIEGLTKLKRDEPFEAPYYDKGNNVTLFNHTLIQPQNLTMIFVEGMFIYKNPKLRELFDFRIYVEVDDDIRLSRMILRENKYLNNNANAFKTFFVIYEKFIKTSFETNIEICKKFANIILPNFELTDDDEVEGDPTLEFLLVNLQNLNKETLKEKKAI